MGKPGSGCKQLRKIVRSWLEPLRLVHFYLLLISSFFNSRIIQSLSNTDMFWRTFVLTISWIENKFISLRSVSLSCSSNHFSPRRMDFLIRILPPRIAGPGLSCKLSACKYSCVISEPLACWTKFTKLGIVSDLFYCRRIGDDTRSLTSLSLNLRWSIFLWYYTRRSVVQLYWLWCVAHRITRSTAYFDISFHGLYLRLTWSTGVSLHNCK